MAVVFHANCVAIDDMEDVWLVGFADEKSSSREYLMLQKSFDDDEQDVRLGMNSYHVERNGQGWSCYGGIERFELHRDRAKVMFTKEGAVRLGKALAMEITFQLDAHEFGKLTECLQRIFASTGCLVEVAAEPRAAPEP